jgi:AraC family transcriptional regulator
VVVANPVTFGRVLREARIGELVFTETEHAPGFRLPEHTHDHAAMTFAVCGEFLEILDGVAVRCSPMSLLFKAADMPHQNVYQGSGARSLIVEMSSTFLSALGPFGDFRAYAIRSDRGVASALAVQLYGRFASHEAACDLDVEELLMEVVTTASQRLRKVLRPVPDWIRRVRDRLHDEHDTTLSLSLLAMDAGVHPVYLARMFRASYRCSIGDYVRARRLDAAVKALLDDEGSACTIGVSAGFYDQSHFSRTFKKATGVAPAAFRQMVRATLSRGV